MGHASSTSSLSGRALRAPPDGWDTEITKTRHRVEAARGTHDSRETWESPHPRVAQDFHQQLGSHLYSLLVVWLGKAFQVFVRGVPNDDGFGLYELRLNEAQESAPR